MAGYQFRGVPDQKLKNLEAELDEAKAENERLTRKVGALYKRIERQGKSRDDALNRVHDMAVALETADKDKRKLKHALDVITEAYEMEKEEKEKQKEAVIKYQEREKELLKRLALLRQEMRMNK